MKRYAKTFAQPARPDSVGPSSNKFTFDLAGVPLSDDHLEQVRSEAVKAAMVAAAALLRGRPAFQDFGTFSTFSTFGTFGQTVGRVEQPATVDLRDISQLPDDARRAIEETVGQLGPGK